MFNKGYIFLKPSLLGGIQKSELERCVNVLEKEDSNVKSIIMDFHRLLSEEMFKTGQMDSGLLLIELQLLQILGNIISHQKDPLILKAAFMLVWDLTNPVAFTPVSQEEITDNFIEGLMFLAQHEILTMRTAGLSGIETMVDLFPEKAKKYTARFYALAPTLGQLTLREENAVLRIADIFVKRCMELIRLEGIVRYATTLKPKPTKELNPQEKLAYDELYQAAVQLVTDWNIQNAPTLPPAKLLRARSPRNVESSSSSLAEQKSPRSVEASTGSLAQPTPTSSQTFTGTLHANLPKPVSDSETYSTFTTLTSITRATSNPAAFVLSENFLEQKSDAIETIIFGKKMSTGIHRLTLKAVGEVTQLQRIGVMNSKLGIPPSGDWLTHNSRGYGYCSNLGRIRDKENGNAGGPVDKLKKNGLITVELDLRPEGERSMRFFVNGKQQKVRVVGLPQTVEFALTMWPPQKWEFISLENYQTRAASPIEGEESIVW